MKIDSAGSAKRSSRFNKNVFISMRARVTAIVLMAMDDSGE
jgi:hypothetical protein